MKAILLLTFFLVTNPTIIQPELTDNETFSRSASYEYNSEDPIKQGEEEEVIEPKALKDKELKDSTNVQGENFETPIFNSNDQKWIEHSQFMSILILSFGFLVICAYILVMIWLGKGWGSNSTQVVIVTLVLVSSIFLVTAGFSEKQIAPVVGLLGTIIGYLLGNNANNNNPSSKKQAVQSNNKETL